MEIEKEKLFKLIIEHNVQIQKMEADMEALLKYKEQLASIGILAQQEVQQTIETSTLYSFENLAKDLGELSITNKEKEELMIALTKMEENKIKLIMHI